MPRTVTIVTPENVRIEYELAGLASRAGAVILDTTIQAITILIIVLGLSLAGLLGGSSGLQWGLVFIIISIFLIYWGYFMVFETIWNGQTPGKRILRLRTVCEGGMPVNFGCAALRNLVRLIDLMPPGMYLVGIICIFITPNCKRLGDLAAGTIVVKERAEWAGDLKMAPVMAQTAPIYSMRNRFPESAYVRNIELVTPEEFEAAKRYVERRIELQPDISEQIAAKIAKPMMARLGIEDMPMIYGNLLCEIYYGCVEERGMQ